MTAAGELPAARGETRSTAKALTGFSASQAPPRAHGLRPALRASGAGGEAAGGHRTHQTPPPYRRPRIPGTRRQRQPPAAAAPPAARSPAELPAGAEAVALLEGLGADGRADLRQEASAPPASAGSGLRRPVAAGAAGWRLLLGAHGVRLLPQERGADSFLSRLGPSPRRAGLPLGGGCAPDRGRCWRRAAGSTRRADGGGDLAAGPRPLTPHLGGREGGARGTRGGAPRGAARNGWAAPPAGGPGEQGGRGVTGVAGAGTRRPSRQVATFK